MKFFKALILFVLSSTFAHADLHNHCDNVAGMAAVGVEYYYDGVSFKDLEKMSNNLYDEGTIDEVTLATWLITFVTVYDNLEFNPAYQGFERDAASDYIFNVVYAGCMVAED